MKRPLSLFILMLSILTLTACTQAPPPETTLAPTETIPTTAVTEAVVEETVPETTAPEAVHWDFTAEEVTGLSISLNGKDRTKAFTDRDRETGRLIEYGTSLTVESETPFSALYLEWDAVPSPYQIRWDGGQAEAGAQGFQHDYVRLPQAVTAVEFVFSDYLEPALCELRAFTEGETPAGVQDWRSPLVQADILVLPAHSDDDALFFGALMSYYGVEMGLDIQTAFMTKHYDDPIRAHERLDGLWEVGIRAYPILGDAPDLYSETLAEAKYEYAAYDILGWQIRQIRRFRPQVIVAHDLNGEYGHGGHMLSAHTLTRAVELASDEGAYPDSAEACGIWDTPKLYFHLYGENQIAIDVDTPLERDPRGRTPFEIAVDAYAHHESQHWCDFKVSRTHPRENCVYFGLYRSTVGPDTTGNLMDHIGYG